MEQSRVRYRKLPGRRRGILFGSSAWMGPDHLLLVKSGRFREEYKRFYLRDVQSIVVAEAPRFHISTRSIALGIVWAIALAFADAYDAGVLARFHLVWILWAIAFLTVAAWVYISAAWSCRCRIFTAVSSEELPSVYRTWTAKRFVTEVGAHIGQVQGVIEGNWAEAVEERQVGPLAAGRIGLAMPMPAPAPWPPNPSPVPPVDPQFTAQPAWQTPPAPAMEAFPGIAPLPGTVPPPAPLPTASAPAQSRTPISILFVAFLCLGGLGELAIARVTADGAARWIMLSCLLLQVIGAVAVLVQTFQGTLRAAFRNLAIVVLVVFGVWYYAVQVSAGIAIGLQNASHPTMRNPFAQSQMTQVAFLSYPWSRGSAGCLSLLLGLVGLVLLLREERQNEPVSFNV